MSIVCVDNKSPQQDYDKPVVARVNDFSEDGHSSLSDAINSAITARQPVLLVEIDSYGGDAYSVMAMVDLLDAAKRMMTVCTYTSGKAMSCGSLLLASGTRGYRFAGPHATVMIHRISASISGDEAMVSAHSRETSRVNKQFFGLMDRLAGKKTSYFERQLKMKAGADWYLSPKDAKRHGLVDHIRTPLHLVSVEVSHRIV